MTEAELKLLAEQEKALLGQWSDDRAEVMKAYDPSKGSQTMVIPDGGSFFVVHPTKETIEAYFLPLEALPTISSIQNTLARAVSRFVAAGSATSYVDVVVGPYMSAAFECFNDVLPESLLAGLDRYVRHTIETNMHILAMNNVEVDQMVLEDDGGIAVVGYAAPPAVVGLGMAYFYETLRESGKTISEATEAAIEVTMKDKGRGAVFGM